MRIIDKLLPLISISMTTSVLAQLPFFLQRLMPKQGGLLGSASSTYPSLYNPLSSASVLSPTYSLASLLGAASNSFGSSLPYSSQSGLGSSSFGSSSLGSLALGSSPYSSVSFGSSYLPQNLLSSTHGLGSSSSLLSSGLGSSAFGSSSLGSSPLSFAANLGSSSFGTSNLGSSSFGTSNLGSSSFGTPNLGSSSFGNSNLGSYSPSSGSTSFTSSGLGSPLFSSASFSSQNSGHSPFAAATYNSPSILGTASSVGQKYQPSNYGSSSYSAFGNSGSFDGLGGFDPIELIEDYPGFSNEGFGKDLNFAGSQAIKFPSSTLGNSYNSYLKRSSTKK